MTHTSRRFCNRLVTSDHWNLKDVPAASTASERMSPFDQRISRSLATLAQVSTFVNQIRSSHTIEVHMRRQISWKWAACLTTLLAASVAPAQTADSRPGAPREAEYRLGPED